MCLSEKIEFPQSKRWNNIPASRCCIGSPAHQFSTPPDARAHNRPTSRPDSCPSVEFGLSSSSSVSQSHHESSMHCVPKICKYSYLLPGELCRIEAAKHVHLIMHQLMHCSSVGPFSSLGMFGSQTVITEHLDHPFPCGYLATWRIWMYMHVDTTMPGSDGVCKRKS